MSGFNQFGMGGGMAPGGNNMGGGNWNNSTGGVGPGGLGSGGMMGGNYGMGGPGWGGGMGYGMLGGMGGMNMGTPGQSPNQGYGWNNSGQGGYDGSSGYNNGNLGMPNTGNMGSNYTQSGNYGTPDGSNSAYTAGNSGNNTSESGYSSNTTGGGYSANTSGSGYSGNTSGSAGFSGNTSGIGNFGNSGTDNWNKSSNNNSSNYGNMSKSVESAPNLDNISSSNNTAMSLGMNLSKQEPSYWDASGRGSNWQAGKSGNLQWSEGVNQTKKGGLNSQDGNKSWPKKDGDKSWQGGKNTNLGNKSWQQKGPQAQAGKNQWQQKQGQGASSSTATTGVSGGNWSSNSGGNMSGNSGVSTAVSRNWNSGTAGGIWSGVSASYEQSNLSSSGSNTGGNQMNKGAVGDGSVGRKGEYWSTGPTGEEKGEALMEISDEEEKVEKPNKRSTKKAPQQGKKSIQNAKGKANVTAQKKQEPAFSTGTGASSTNKKTEKAKEQETYNCQICDVTVKGLMPYLIHVQGQRHLRAEAEKREKDLEKNKGLPRKSTLGLLSKGKATPVPDSRALGITVTPKPSILRNKRSTDYPIDTPSDSKMGRYEDRPMGTSHNTGRYDEYGRNDPGPGRSFGRREELVPTYSGTVSQSQQDKPLVFDYGHSKTGQQSSYDSSVHQQDSAEYGQKTSSIPGLEPSIDPQLGLQQALDTVLSMVQGTGLTGMNPLATSIQAAIDTKVQAAVSAQLQGTLMANQGGTNTSAGNQSMSLSTSSPSRAAPVKSDPVFATPEVKFPEKPMMLDVKSSGLVKISEGKYATFGKYMRQKENVRKEERGRRRYLPEASETESSHASEKKEKPDISQAISAELARLGPSKDQAVISSIVSKVVKEYMELQSDDKDDVTHNKRPTISQEQKEKEAIAATNPSRDKSPKTQQAPRAPTRPLPNLTPSGKKQEVQATKRPPPPRRKRTPPAPVKFSVQPVKPTQAFRTQPTIVLGDSDSESETATSSGTETIPTVTTTKSSVPKTKPIPTISTKTTMMAKTIPVMTSGKLYTPQPVPKPEPVPPGTENSKTTKMKKEQEKLAEKGKKKVPKEEKKKKKSEKRRDWGGQFDEDFAKKREELDKILSAGIVKPKPKPKPKPAPKLDRKRSDSLKGDRLTQLKKRKDDIDSSPYEDISDMSDISSDESYLGERKVEVVRRIEKVRGYHREVSCSPPRHSTDPYRAMEGYMKPRKEPEGYHKYRSRSRSLSPRPRRRHSSRSPDRSHIRSISPRSHQRRKSVKERLGPQRSPPPRTSVRERLGPKPSGSSRKSISPERLHPSGGLVPRKRSLESPSRDRIPSMSPTRLHPDGGLVPRRVRDLSPLSLPRDRLGSLSPPDLRHADRVPREREHADRVPREREHADRVPREREHADRVPRERERADRVPREREYADRVPRERERRTSHDRPRGGSSLSPPRDRLGSLTPSEERAMLQIKPWQFDHMKDNPPSHHSSRQVSPLRSTHDRSLSPISDDEKSVGGPESDLPHDNKARGEDWYEQDEPLLQIPAEKITTAYGALLNVLAPGCVQNESDLILATQMIAELTQALVVLMEGKVDQDYRDRFIKAADGFAVNHGEHPLVAAFHDASNVAPAIIITLSQQEPAFLQQMMQILLTRSDILERVLHSNDELMDFIKAAEVGNVDP